MTNAILRGKPDAGNPHVRFDEGEVASYPPTAGRPEGVATRGAKPRRGSLLNKKILFAAVVAVAMESWAYAPVKGTLMTEWGEKVKPENVWPSHPRPQLIHCGEGNHFKILNGEWDYAITSVTNTPGRPTKWDGKILVPFAPESALSGVGKALEPDQFLWYTREINCSKVSGERILLHFGAVDFRTMVFIGHLEVTDVPHEGGQNPFTLDITDYVNNGPNELTVCVWDPTEDFVNSRGKQSFKPKGCFYTRVSGIWQTVWIENVPEDYIAGYRVITDVDKGEVKIEIEKRGGGGQRTEISVFDSGGAKIGDMIPLSTSTFSLCLPDAHLWCPEDPYLYHFKATCGRDVVSGYFGMRKFEKRKDVNGILRFYLNNKPYYMMATLDQGWWPDGLLTPPSEEAMAFDIKTLKDCGFNTMRKHIKVEPLRYYALCDKMGLLVIQDLPSGNGDAMSPYRVSTTSRYGLQRQEQKELMDLLQAIPSIVMWNPYNEGWTQPGAFLTHAMLDFVRRNDPSRLVDGPSGWCDFEGGSPVFNCNPKWEIPHNPPNVCEAGDVIDLHCYRGPGMPPVNDRRVSFLGEFGGLGHPVEGHLWKEAKGNWAYGGIEDTKTREGLAKVYLGLMDKLEELATKGLGGSVYTQTTDVEIEINGLMTYDRKVLKYNPMALKAAHERIVMAAQTAAMGR